MAYALLTSAVLIGVIWCLTLRFLAWSGGWLRLAETYPGSKSPDGARLRSYWLTVGWVDYNGCIMYSVNAEGLHISLWPVFNAGHAPLFIPWAEMRVDKVYKQFGRRGQVVQLHVGDPVVARLRLPEAVFEAGQQALSDGALDQEADIASSS